MSNYPCGLTASGVALLLMIYARADRKDWIDLYGAHIPELMQQGFADSQGFPTEKGKSLAVAILHLKLEHVWKPQTREGER